jgi:L-arabinose isomerase
MNFHVVLLALSSIAKLYERVNENTAVIGDIEYIHSFSSQKSLY